MTYRSVFVPNKVVHDIRMAIANLASEKAQSIFANAISGHENEDSRWQELLALRDIALIFEGADKEDKSICISAFDSQYDSGCCAHMEAEFIFHNTESQEDES